MAVTSLRLNFDSRLRLRFCPFSPGVRTDVALAGDCALSRLLTARLRLSFFLLVLGVCRDDTLVEDCAVSCLLSMPFAVGINSA